MSQHRGVPQNPTTIWDDGGLVFKVGLFFMLLLVGYLVLYLIHVGQQYEREEAAKAAAKEAAEKKKKPAKTD
jgi:hypothetical protein